MSASTQLDQYIAAFRYRLKTLTLLQGLALLALVLLMVSAAAAWVTTQSAYAPATVAIARLLLVAALGATGFWCLYRPLKNLGQSLGHELEHRTPSYKGRIETYLEARAEHNPFSELLAEDALKASGGRAVSDTIPQKELALSASVGGLALAILLYLLLAGPGLFGFSLQNLLAGWAIADFTPPQSITVSPGDQSVRRGANLRVTSLMDGFSPDAATIHVRGSDGSWQDVSMAGANGGFEFTFFSMQEDMQYYVSTTGMRSPTYEVQVVDVPTIEHLALTYHYPDWTRREPATVDPGGDIDALPDTRIELSVTTSAPLQNGLLVLNSEDQALQADGLTATSDFTVMAEGEYYIATRVGSETVRLSDDYFIRITEDGKPELEFVKPGQDYNASSIEEVHTVLTARDDFGLESLTLHYSINGGETVQVDLNPELELELTAEHIFMLEDMRSPVRTPVSGTRVGALTIVTGTEEEEDSAAPEPELVPLKAGDLISYYAEATDRNNQVRTDMYFIQVQPYNRRWSQSQLSGGAGGGGQQGGPQDEISQRQRQIVVSTWNLIREQGENADDPNVPLNSSLLSDLQTTLAEQAQTLADRARARRLENDPQIEEFVASIDMAVQSMYPAADRLGEVALNDAIQPAQEALQHLLRAESIFTDMTVQQQQGNQGGGGGSQAQRDLAEMFELEMDIEKNQYETGSQAQSSQSQQQEAEDIMDQLDELARRQQQLTRNLASQNQLTDAQRWQQDMLRREAEELQERLDQLQRQQNSQQASNQQQQGQPGQAGQQGGQNGDPSQQQQGEQNPQVGQSELQRRLDSAIRAMTETSEAMRGNQSQQELQRSAEEAMRQLEGARDEVSRQQVANMEQNFSNMAGQAEDLLREQQRMQRQLQDAMRRAAQERESGDNPNSRGMDIADEWQLARDKQALAQQLQQLQQQMITSMQEYGERVPEATRELQRANTELNDNEIQQLLEDAALYIDSGYGLYIAGQESGVTGAMRELQERLARAEDMALGSSGPPSSDQDLALAQAQSLRNEMQRLARDGQQGQQNSEQAERQQAQEGPQQAQSGQGQQGGGQRGNQTAGSNGGWRQSGAGTQQGTINLPDNFFEQVDDLARTARGALPDMNLGREDLAAMYDLVRELEYTRVNRNDEILAQEFNEMLALIEQLEVGLKLAEPGKDNLVRTAIQDAIPEEYQDSVAEYYRRLSRD